MSSGTNTAMQILVGDSKNAQYPKMNILLDLDRLIYISDIHAQQRDLKRDLIATEYSDVLPICC